MHYKLINRSVLHIELKNVLFALLLVINKYVIVVIIDCNYLRIIGQNILESFKLLSIIFGNIIAHEQNSAEELDNLAYQFLLLRCELDIRSSEKENVGVAEEGSAVEAAAINAVSDCVRS